MNKTINIEGREYYIEGDVFTTPDGLYDVFWTRNGYNYALAKREDTSEFNENLANKSYLSGFLLIVFVITTIGVIIFQTFK